MGALISKSIIWVCLLASLIAVVIFRQSGQSTKKAVINDQLQQNMLAKGSQIIQFQYDSNGQLTRSLKAQKVIDFKKAPQQLFYPSLITYQKQLGRWQVSSNYADLENDVIYLQKNVSINQLNHYDPVQLLTEQLDYHLDKQYAQGELPVLISNSQSTTQGTGIRAQFSPQHSQFKLLSDVKSTYYE